jgi:hypothetical protein
VGRRGKLSELETFLSGFERSRSREYVLTTRLVHDLTVAAAGSGYDLLVYLPTVDADGFDVVFDDRDRLVPIQLKSMVARGQADGWKIRRSLLRPAPEEVDLFGFEPSPRGAGRGGGVILSTVRAADDHVEVVYAYTDIAILSTIWAGIVARPRPQLQRLLRLRRELEADATGSVEVPRSAFLSVSTPTALLALMGLHSRVPSTWRLHLWSLLRHENLHVELPAPEEALRAGIANELASFRQAQRATS